MEYCKKVDYFETFIAVVKTLTNKALFAINSHTKLDSYQLIQLLIFSTAVQIPRSILSNPRYFTMGIMAKFWIFNEFSMNLNSLLGWGSIYSQKKLTLSNSIIHITMMFCFLTKRVNTWISMLTIFKLLVLVTRSMKN